MHLQAACAHLQSNCSWCCGTASLLERQISKHQSAGRTQNLQLWGKGHGAITQHCASAGGAQCLGGAEAHWWARAGCCLQRGPAAQEDQRHHAQGSGWHQLCPETSSQHVVGRCQQARHVVLALLHVLKCLQGSKEPLNPRCMLSSYRRHYELKLHAALTQAMS